MTFDFTCPSRHAAESTRGNAGSSLGLPIEAWGRSAVLAALVMIGVCLPACRRQAATPQQASTSSTTASSSPDASAEKTTPVSPAEETPTDVVAKEQTASNEDISSKPSGSDETNQSGEASGSTAAMKSESPAEQGGPLTQAELDAEYVPDPEIMAELEAQAKALRELADTFGPPAGGTQLGVQPDLWIDRKAKRVYVDGYVAMRRGPLEMLACPVGTKEHESVIALFAKSSEVHAALLAIGAESGTTARWDPDFKPPTGQTVSVWVIYRNEKEAAAADQPEDENNRSRYRPFVPGDQFKVVDARRWVRNVETKEALTEPWVFAGSEFWTDPVDKVEHYSANAGDMICVSNFSTAMMDVPFASSADAGNTLFEPFTERIPEQGTPVRVVLVPQPNEGGETERSIAPEQPPETNMLPLVDDSEDADSENAESPKEKVDEGS